jgi:TolB protein
MNAGSDWAPSWSPDRRQQKIAFQSSRGGGDYEIFLMDADGSGQTPLTSNSLDDAYPKWGK